MSRRMSAATLLELPRLGTGKVNYRELEKIV